MYHNDGTFSWSAGNGFILISKRYCFECKSQCFGGWEVGGDRNINLGYLPSWIVFARNFVKIAGFHSPRLLYNHANCTTIEILDEKATSTLTPSLTRPSSVTTAALHRIVMSCFFLSIICHKFGS